MLSLLAFAWTVPKTRLRLSLLAFPILIPKRGGDVGGVMGPWLLSVLERGSALSSSMSKTVSGREGRGGSDFTVASTISFPCCDAPNGSPALNAGAGVPAFLAASSSNRGMRLSVFERTVVLWRLAGEGEGGIKFKSSSTSQASFSFCAFTRSECVDRPSGRCDPGETEPIGELGLECTGVDVAGFGAGNTMGERPSGDSDRR